MYNGPTRVVWFLHVGVLVAYVAYHFSDEISRVQQCARLFTVASTHMLVMGHENWYYLHAQAFHVPSCILVEDSRPSFLGLSITASPLPLLVSLILRKPNEAANSECYDTDNLIVYTGSSNTWVGVRAP